MASVYPALATSGLQGMKGALPFTAVLIHLHELLYIQLLFGQKQSDLAVRRSARLSLSPPSGTFIRKKKQQQLETSSSSGICPVMVLRWEMKLCKPWFGTYTS